MKRFVLTLTLVVTAALALASLASAQAPGSARSSSRGAPTFIRGGSRPTWVRGNGSRPTWMRGSSSPSRGKGSRTRQVRDIR